MDYKSFKWKKWCSLIWVVLFPLFMLSQSRSEYSKNGRSGYDTPIDSISIYLESASILKGSQPLKAISSIHRAIEISLLQNNNAQASNAYLMLGDIQMQLNQPGLAIENYKRCLQSNQRSDYSNYNGSNDAASIQLMFRANRQLALAHEQLNQFSQAKEYIDTNKKNYQSYASTTDWREHVRIEARIMGGLGKYDEAVSLLNKQLESESDPNSQKDRVMTLITLGKLYRLQGNSGKSNEILIEAKKIADLRGFNELSITTNNDLAFNYQQQGDFTQEVQSRNSNIELNQKSNNQQAISNDNLAIGNAYFNSENIDQAEGYYQKSLDGVFHDENKTQTGDAFEPIPYRSSQLQVGADALKSLAKVYLKKNDLQKALNYYQQYEKLQDSIQIIRTNELNDAIQLSSGLGKNQQRIEMLELERSLSDKSIEILQQDRELKEGQLFTRNLVIGVLGGFLLFLIGAGFMMIRNNKAKTKADKLLTLQSLSGQMNPHFIFNALNSVNEYISNNDEREANRYLSSFSKLMRQVMDDSKHSFIPLNEEIEMLQLYLKLEHGRFKDQFQYDFHVDDQLLNAEFVIPPMIIQPYLENAIWHGLRYRQSTGKLSIQFTRKDDELEVVIVDDGIGIDQSKSLKTQNQKKQVSLGMKNTSNRIQLLNEIYAIGIELDLQPTFSRAENPGTTVKITIPQHKIPETTYS
jgi:hypothetical protein